MFVLAVFSCVSSDWLLFPLSETDGSLVTTEPLDGPLARGILAKQ